MKQITINAASFFEMLKLRDASMWEIFSQMIDGDEKMIIFLDEEEKVLFDYKLPSTLEQLNQDREIFAKEYSEKLAKRN